MYPVIKERDFEFLSQWFINFEFQLYILLKSLKYHLKDLNFYYVHSLYTLLKLYTVIYVLEDLYNLYYNEFINKILLHFTE
jgi:hypothetical protein